MSKILWQNDKECWPWSNCFREQFDLGVQCSVWHVCLNIWGQYGKIGIVCSCGIRGITVLNQSVEVFPLDSFLCTCLNKFCFPWNIIVYWIDKLWYNFEAVIYGNVVWFNEIDSALIFRNYYHTNSCLLWSESFVKYELTFTLSGHSQQTTKR